MSDDVKEKLFKKYGDILEIKVDSFYKGAEETFTRTDNFGLIGGGIALNNSSCTTAATAKRNTEKFIITAGHCLNSYRKEIKSV
ncbi:S1 family peptidase [Paenibacillus alkaliterrae]|uniref:S1 family peptidase n=1 Tax=Paenibacillus alkaliterrae TaxID=320909 RepID=UPI001F322503|nr:S1 family peptidase [Paenibacillus alkaliterrae]MCF2939561.1 S1 family peptidase [Paenibacillus alkaliterrae]